MWLKYRGSNHRENQGKRVLVVNPFEISFSLFPLGSLNLHHWSPSTSYWNHLSCDLITPSLGRSIYGHLGTFCLSELQREGVSGAFSGSRWPKLLLNALTMLMTASPPPPQQGTPAVWRRRYPLFLWVGGLLKSLIWGACFPDTEHMHRPVVLKSLLRLNDGWNLIKYEGPGALPYFEEPLLLCALSSSPGGAKTPPSLRTTVSATARKGNVY